MKEVEAFTNQQGVLYRQVYQQGMVEPIHALVVPEKLRSTLLATAHGDPLTGGHLAAHKVFEKLRARYWWPKMYWHANEHCKQ